MKTFDVQNIEINLSADVAHRFIGDPANLPKWTNAFSSADRSNAVMRTPDGEVRIELRTEADAETGAVDWTMTFPDKAVGHAFSRVVPVAADRCVYVFVLLAPPVALEMLEGALNVQMQTLAKELAVLKQILESH